MSQGTNPLNAILAAAILAFGIGASGFFISETLYKSKVALNTAEVKGLAERRVQADTAYWTIEYTVSGRSKSDIPKLYQQSEVDQTKIVSLLRDNGFESNEIKLGVINYIKREYRDENQKVVDEKHVLVG